MNVEDDLGEGTIQFVFLNAVSVSTLDHVWHETIASGIGKIVINERVARNVDLRRQLAVAIGAYEEMDVGGALAVAAECRQSCSVGLPGGTP